MAEAIQPPLIAFRNGRLGVMVTVVRSLENFTKGLLAGRTNGPRLGDAVIDSSLRRFRVAASTAVGVSVLGVVRSLVSPRPVRFEVSFEPPESVSLDDAKKAVTEAMTSSRSVREYWEETSIGVDERLRKVASADSFDALCRALRH